MLSRMAPCTSLLHYILARACAYTLDDSDSDSDVGAGVFGKVITGTIYTLYFGTELCIF